MPSGGQNKISRETLFRDIASVAAIVGETPKLSEYREHGDHSAKAIYNEFDSWNAALDELDLAVHHRKNKERIQYNCDNPGCSKTINRLESDLEESEFNYCSQQCHYKHNSQRYSGEDNPSWNRVSVKCDNCGEEISIPNWDADRYERHYCDRDCYNDGLRTSECDWCGEEFKVWRSLEDVQRFCSYKCSGKWRAENITGEDHPRWRGGYDTEYYGPNWLKQRRRAVIRDQARCQDCGLTEKQSRERFGESLSVHHITPIREFVDAGDLDFERANRIENLDTLCRPCHSYRETQAVGTDY